MLFFSFFSLAWIVCLLYSGIPCGLSEDRVEHKLQGDFRQCSDYSSHLIWPHLSCDLNWSDLSELELGHAVWSDPVRRGCNQSQCTKFVRNDVSCDEMGWRVMRLWTLFKLQGDSRERSYCLSLLTSSDCDWPPYTLNWVRCDWSRPRQTGSRALKRYSSPRAWLRCITAHSLS